MSDVGFYVEHSPEGETKRRPWSQSAWNAHHARQKVLNAVGKANAEGREWRLPDGSVDLKGLGLTS